MYNIDEQEDLRSSSVGWMYVNKVFKQKVGLSKVKMHYSDIFWT